MTQQRPFRVCGVAAFVLFCLASSSAPAFAGGWTQAEGEFYLKVWERAIRGTNAFDIDGEVVESFEYTDVALNLYAEYGITDGWTGVAMATPVGWASVDSSTTYVGPSVLGIRRALLRGPVHLALELRAGYTPDVGEKNLAPAPAAGGPSFFYVPTVESRRSDLELQVGYGFSWGWVSASVASRWESAEGVDPAVLGFLQLGYSRGSFVADIHMGAYEPLGDVEVTNVAGAGQTRYLGLGPSVSYWFTERVAVNLAAEGVFYAESNAATPSLLAGVEVR